MHALFGEICVIRCVTIISVKIEVLPAPQQVLLTLWVSPLPPRHLALLHSSLVPLPIVLHFLD